MILRSLLASSALLVLVLLALGLAYRPKPPPQEILSFHGTSATLLDAGACSRVVPFEETPEMTIGDLKPDALLRIRGQLAGECGPVLIEITKPAKSGTEALEQSAVFIPESNECDPMPFDIQLNAPLKPGVYTLKIRQPPDHFLARGTLKIVK